MNDQLSASPLVVAAVVLLAVLVAALLVGLLLVWRGASRRTAATAELTADLTTALGDAEARAAELTRRLERLERRAGAGGEPLTGVVAPGPGASTGQDAGRSGGTGATDRAGDGTALEGRIDGRLFTDIVAREATVKAAGLWHGLRVALTPENRNRIRFEMKQEVKRSRRQRRDDLKVALRDLRARERAALGREERAGGDGEDAA